MLFVVSNVSTILGVRHNEDIQKNCMRNESILFENNVRRINSIFIYPNAYHCRRENIQRDDEEEIKNIDKIYRFWENASHFLLCR